VRGAGYPGGQWVPTPTLPAAPLISGTGPRKSEFGIAPRSSQVLTVLALLSTVYFELGARPVITAR
jgi:hypothetical protein